MKRIKIFDTTLRDGEQSPGCSMNLTEKIEMARLISSLASYSGDDRKREKAAEYAKAALKKIGE